MSRVALVTGASGQDGRYLTRLLLDRGYEVHGQTRLASDDILKTGMHWHVGDLTDSDFLSDTIAAAKPDEIYNLAAVSRPTLSWQEPWQTAELNALVPQRICEILLKLRSGCRLFQASTSDIFGDGFQELQDEKSYCFPTSPYGITKLYAHRIISAYRKQYGLHACTGIMFNHESPLRPLSFVSQKICYAAVALSRGITRSDALDELGRPIVDGGKVFLGDLSVRRDFGFAGDYVEAMYMIMQHPAPDDYVVGSGAEHSIQEFCERAFRKVGLDWMNYVLMDPKLVRKADSHYTRADSRKIREVLGWQPKVDFDSLISLMIDAQTRKFQPAGPS